MPKKWRNLIFWQIPVADLYIQKRLMEQLSANEGWGIRVISMSIFLFWRFYRKIHGAFLAPARSFIFSSIVGIGPSIFLK